MTELLATMRDFASTRGAEYDPADEKALMMLEVASDLVRRHTGQLFAYVQDDVIDVPGSGFDSVLLPQLPALDVTAVSLLGWSSTDDPYVLEAPDAWYLDQHGQLYRLPAGCEYWPRGRGNVRITYSHGYVLPLADEPEFEEEDVDHVAPSPLPSDLQMVVMQLAARLYAAGTTGGEGNAVEEISRSIMSYSETVRMAGSDNLTSFELAVLDGYTVVQ